MKSACYFGEYSPDYSRNRIIIKGLERNHIRVYQCHENGFLIYRYIKLVKQFVSIADKIDSIVIGFPGYLDILLGFILGRIFRKKLYFDIFTSRYETLVLDRSYVSENSLKSRAYYYIDLIGIRLCDVLIVDTKSHLESYKKIYHLKKIKAITAYVGSDSDIFYPINTAETTDILFYGSYQPLQGVEVIIKAASRLPKVKFLLIGNGQTRETAENMTKDLGLKNVRFKNWISLKNLNNEINKAKMVLGIFGNSLKAKSVIPNKVYDGLACKKAVLTLKTSATTELLKDKCVLVNNEKELAEKIEELLNDRIKRNRIAKLGYNFYLAKLRPEYIVRDLVK